MMAAVAAMMSTITMAITPPMMATVLSVLETELAGSEGAAVCGGGVVVVHTCQPADSLVLEICIKCA